MLVSTSATEDAVGDRCVQLKLFCLAPYHELESTATTVVALTRNVMIIQYICQHHQLPS